MTGIYILPSCFPQSYRIVRDAKTWTEAQRYCREKYTDLVTINSEEDMIRLSHLLWDDDDEVWIGLHSDFNHWKWSLKKEGFYKEGEAEFRNWNVNEPNADTDKDKSSVCVDIGTNGQWSDYFCRGSRWFICYNESSETKYIYLRKAMNWTDAQSYCRKHYTDLPSVRNITENKAIQNIVEGYSWIGLYRDPWKWSDGEVRHINSFNNWKAGQPEKTMNSCVTTTYSKWNTRLCNDEYAFACSVKVSKQTVKVMLTKSDFSGDLEEMQDEILEQFNQRLKDHGLEEFKLKWIKQPDGKIFHLKETEDQDEK
ncbi:macrophage mannose receptor 1-like [Morone saxatilis]|uniref:macrophage mannose receptor 1-like n=1 Tax=Morone saxatilis TaxID=34816 RepID=UPI0015E25167|nr:macrophage mannose receptor 1-like [Morone saxatilis]